MEKKILFYSWVPGRPRPKFTVHALDTALTLLLAQKTKIPFPLFFKKKNTPEIVLVQKWTLLGISTAFQFKRNTHALRVQNRFEGPMIKDTKCVVQREAAILQSSCGKLSTSSIFCFAQNWSPNLIMKLIRARRCNRFLSQNGQTHKEGKKWWLSPAWLGPTLNSGQRAHISQRDCPTTAVV